MKSEVNFRFPTETARFWGDGKGPKIEFSISNEGDMGIWVTVDGEIQCWSSVSIADLNAIMAVCESMGISEDTDGE